MTVRLLALCLAALPMLAQAQTAPATAPETTAEQMQAAMTTAAGFAERAASSGLFEIQTSEMAGAVATSDEVKAFAAQMVQDHVAADAALKEAARTDGVGVPAEMMADHRAQLEALKALGPDFDASYLAVQVAAHEEAVALFEGYANQGEDGALREFAAQTLPKLKEHLTMARGLAGI